MSTTIDGVRYHKRSLNHIGKTYGHSVVLALDGRGENNQLRLKCRCKCGEIFVAEARNLANKHPRSQTKGCGCEARVAFKKYIEAKKLSPNERRMRRIWNGMIKRCTHPNDPGFYLYGGRGVTICPRWLESVENFIADMGFPPTSRHSIDRVDNDGNYEPGNCRWATSADQARNTRKTRLSMEIARAMRARAKVLLDAGVPKPRVSSTVSVEFEVSPSDTCNILADRFWRESGESYSTERRRQRRASAN